MVRVIVLSGLLILLCQQMLVVAHFLSRPYPANSLAKLKTLLLQLEDTLAQAEGGPDYGELSPEADPGQASQGWGGQEESPRPQAEEAGLPEETQNMQSIKNQRNGLLDLIMAARSKTFSACFGGRLDRIGTSSGLGCNTSRG
ncbi:natriuretic peptides A [Clupea harengus]|uniref:Natriuretic peptides A n=1 Tax=Clupea harengus TaxID=7950 RepID=A0A6P3W2Y2_CLUHA|nr:natriuretic peptides A-like [Clupea harengus]XP_042563468.1 natriuretic peptides A [Clupea harengus]